jgi:hypothetical protein
MLRDHVDLVGDIEMAVLLRRPSCASKIFQLPGGQLTKITTPVQDGREVSIGRVEHDAHKHRQEAE